MPTITPTLIVAALLLLIPFLFAGFFPERFRRLARLPLATRILLPALLCVPYLLVALSARQLHAGWALLYALLPPAICALLDYAQRIDPTQRGSWPDLVVLATFGLAVDLRWLEPAWPPHLAVFNKILLLDLGIWGFFLVRGLDGAGFDLRIRGRDLRTGLLHFALYTPIALALGLSLGFLHLHPVLPNPLHAAAAFAFTFLFIAVPEELFFRGWVQNLLARRIGQTPALLLTSLLFGLSHFNKRALHFNWRYVLLAAIAGWFYGRAWARDRRVAASAITHASVDTVWSLWLR